MKRIILLILLLPSVLYATYVPPTTPQWSVNVIGAFMYGYHQTAAQCDNLADGSSDATYVSSTSPNGYYNWVTYTPFEGLYAIHFTGALTGYGQINALTGRWYGASGLTYECAYRPNVGATDNNFDGIAYPNVQLGFMNSGTNVDNIAIIVSGSTYYMGNYNHNTEQGTWIDIGITHKPSTGELCVYKNNVLIYTVNGITTNVFNEQSYYVGVGAAWSNFDVDYRIYSAAIEPSFPVIPLAQQTALASIATLTAIPTCPVITNTPTPNATQTYVVQATQTQVAAKFTQTAIAQATLNAMYTSTAQANATLTAIANFTSTITPTTTQTNVPNATYTVTNSPTSTNTATITATYIPAMALNLGNTNTVWADGVTWTADNNLSNWTVTGGILENHYPISNTSLQNVFGYNRYSATDITITTAVLTGVRYLITMDFATYLNSYRDLQDISCNGVMIYPALDVYGTVGVYSALTKQFYAYPNNAGFSFNFHTVSGDTGSFINGIRLDQSGATNTPTISQTATKTNTVTVSPTVTATTTMTWTVTSTPTVNVNIFRINAGNQSTTTTAYGVSWNIDTPYNSSYGYVNNHIIHSVTYTVKGTNYQTLYGKWATTSNTNLEYQFNCSSATYRITLKFTDFISTAKAQNIQSVYINNALISNMNSLDIYSLVGNGTALDYVIYYQFTNIGSPLVLDLRKVTGSQFINALSVEAVNPAIISAQHIQLNKGYSSLIQTP